MIKHFPLLLMFGLLGCHSEPQFPNPIEPTENKRETIQKWLGDFYCGKDGYIDWYWAGPMQNGDYIGDAMPFNFYGPILPYSLQSQKKLCSPDPSNYPKVTINHYKSNKKSIFVFKPDFRNDKEYVYLSNDLKEQCDKSYETIKNQYSSFMKDGIIDDTEYKQLNNVYLKEHSNVINTIRLLDKQSKEDDWKEKNLDEYNDKNGINVKLHNINKNNDDEE